MDTGFTWLAVADVARRVGRARSTVRLWQDQHRAWVPVEHDERGHQLYPLERIEEIAVLAASNLTPREISAELARRHATDGDPPFADVQAQQLEEMRAIRRLLERIADHLGAGDTSAEQS